MGSFANALFTTMLGWLQGAAAAIWSAFTTENGGTFFQWFGKNWIYAALFLLLIGLATDLIVYLLRWRPLKVWKSFFTRGRNHTPGDTGEQTDSVDHTYLFSGYAPVRDNDELLDSAVPEYNPPEIEKKEKPFARETLNAREEEPELDAWKEADVSPEKEYREQKAIVTRAGYIVPEDSPYRRAEKVEVSSDRHVPNSPGNEAEKEIRAMKSRRRKRINVSDLFSDPEEEIYEFEAPQNVIDRNQAYRNPVYPTGWKKNEE